MGLFLTFSLLLMPYIEFICVPHGCWVHWYARPRRREGWSVSWQGFKIENGEITTPLRDVSLSGNILETLKNVDAIGNDFELSVGFCGKDGQTAPVGDGGPHTRILNALVGGSS